MATLPDEEEAPQPVAERVVRSITAPITQRPKAITLLAIAALGGAQAPAPFGAITAGALVLAAYEYARRLR